MELAPHLAHRASYRDPEAAPGGTAEALKRELQRVRQHTRGLRTLEAARTIAPQRDPARYRSHSFQVLRAGLLEMPAYAGAPWVWTGAAC